MWLRHMEDKVNRPDTADRAHKAEMVGKADTEEMETEVRMPSRTTLGVQFLRDVLDWKGNSLGHSISSPSDPPGDRYDQRVAPRRGTTSTRLVALLISF